jgi:rhodanese-related sulfurtransferase
MELNRPSLRRRAEGWTLIAMLTVVGALAGCGGAPPGVRQLPATQAVADIDARTVIDVRTPAELLDGMVLGAVNIDLQAPDFRARIAQLDRDAKYLVYCRTGNRSAQAVAIMADLGFTDVVDGGGFPELAAAGAPTSP